MFLPLSRITRNTKFCVAGKCDLTFPKWAIVKIPKLFPNFSCVNNHFIYFQFVVLFDHLEFIPRYEIKFIVLYYIMYYVLYCLHYIVVLFCIVLHRTVYCYVLYCTVLPLKEIGFLRFVIKIATFDFPDKILAVSFQAIKAAYEISNI